jgi:hypothetical protein
MASIIPVEGKWRAHVRRKGHEVQTKTFEKKADAEHGARSVEADIEAGRASGVQVSKSKTIADVIAL